MNYNAEITCNPNDLQKQWKHMADKCSQILINMNSIRF